MTNLNKLLILSTALILSSVSALADPPVPHPAPSDCAIVRDGNAPRPDQVTTPTVTNSTSTGAIAPSH